MAVEVDLAPLELLIVETEATDSEWAASIIWSEASKTSGAIL